MQIPCNVISVDGFHFFVTIINSNFHIAFLKLSWFSNKQLHEKKN